MKFKKLNEALTDSQIYENLQEYIYNKLESAVDNLAIQAASDVEGYNADWCSDDVNPHAYGYLSKVAEYFADELMRYSPRGEIVESLLTEKKWDYQLKNGVALRNAIDAEDYGQIKNSLIAAYKEIHEVMPEKFDEYDLENKLEDLEYLDTEPDADIEISEDDIRENFDYELSDLYDLCDNLNIWVSLE